MLVAAIVVSEMKERLSPNIEPPTTVATQRGRCRPPLSETAAEQPIPVGVITPEAGYYTFSLVEDLDVSEVEHVWLWDYEKSSQTDLLTDDYLFYSTPGKLEDRFAINVILKKVSEITTDVNMLDMEVNDVPYKFIWNDQIYIMYHGVVYDITGRRVLEINK